MFHNLLALVANETITMESTETFLCGSAFEEESFGQRREVFGRLVHRRNGVFDLEVDCCERADMLEIGQRFDIEGETNGRRHIENFDSVRESVAFNGKWREGVNWSSCRMNNPSNPSDCYDIKQWTMCRLTDQCGVVYSRSKNPFQ